MACNGSAAASKTAAVDASQLYSAVQARNSGYFAACDGKDLADNPWQPASATYDAWRNGWYDWHGRSDEMAANGR